MKYPPWLFGNVWDGRYGKDDQSKVLCNEYSPEFLAKVGHVELNSDSTMNLQKRLLHLLTKWKEDDLTRKVTDLNQVRHLFENM